MVQTGLNGENVVQDGKADLSSKPGNSQGVKASRQRKRRDFDSAGFLSLRESL